MATVTSPRASNPSGSLASTPTASRTTSPAPVRRQHRAALRDYYNLKTTVPANATSPSHPHPSEPEPPSSELDASDFDADAYVKSVLAGHGLEGVLRVEAGLVNEIKGLDGERKALVYDNYSKLITATDTIRKMRNNMDPLTPTTSTLSPAVAHIAETARGLVAGVGLGKSGKERKEAARKRRENDTVRWVLGTPRRLEELLEAGNVEDAKKDWEEIQRILKKWEDVAGVEELRIQCEKTMSKL
ncbi:MAG: hypothetical protein ALECFALPRED_003297 [Alectoria fallacina]|uniref:Vacuolar protein sorting-associated protein 51 homolog n=1 Tax=Alectoria fallacina TaxID=1903189 RepID=A0A8H3HY63_9LECA|nr:MAG: hypothetical protein ALECFALPRED_003297 [Alectoria fallacina]